MGHRRDLIKGRTFNGGGWIAAGQEAVGCAVSSRTDALGMLEPSQDGNSSVQWIEAAIDLPNWSRPSTDVGYQLQSPCKAKPCPTYKASSLLGMSLSRSSAAHSSNGRLSEIPPAPRRNVRRLNFIFVSHFVVMDHSLIGTSFLMDLKDASIGEKGLL